MLVSRCSAVLLVMWTICATACTGGSDEPPVSNDDSDDDDSDDDDSDDDGQGTETWDTILEDLPGGLFSVHGVSTKDVWSVGANRRGDGPTILHWDGKSWSFLDSGLSSEDLFWVYVFETGLVMIGGSDGTILSKPKRAEEFELMPTPSTNTVWGVWGSAADDVWAVGGEASGKTGFIWHFDGEAWSVVDDAELPATDAWFKVWGTAQDNVWFCGTEGALAHYDGQRFQTLAAQTERSLLTINGAPDGSVVTAVGGQVSGVLVSSSNGKKFKDVTPSAPPPQLFGVAHSDELAYAVGTSGTVLRQERGAAWEFDDAEIDTFQDLHGAWIDPEGGVWAVGGQIIVRPFTSGVLVYRGEAPPLGKLK